MAKTSQRIIDRRGNVAAPDIKYTGQEPTWDDSDKLSYEEYNSRLERGLRFYGYYCDTKICKEWLLKWMIKNKYSKHEVSLIKSLMPTSIPSTLGKLSRMLDRGMLSAHPDQDKIYNKKVKEAADDEIIKRRLTAQEWIDQQLQIILDEFKYNTISDIEDDSENPVEKKKISPLTRVKNKVNEDIIVQLDILLDDIIKITDKTSPTKIPTLDLGRLMRGHNTPGNGVKHIVAWINKHLDEFTAAYDKTDEEMVEGYSWLRRPQLGKIKKNFEKMLEEVKHYSRNKVKTRKPRVKKPKTVDKQVSKLKYATESQEFQLTSVDPMGIPFSQTALFFNTKYRQLSIYYASGSSGLEIKGTTLQNFNKETSITLTLRKPEDFLPIILSSTPKKLEKAIATLTTKSKKANGRINANMVILRTLDTVLIK